MVLNEKIRKSLWFHLLLVLLACTVIYVLFFMSLSILTNHGEEVMVPKVIGKDYREAKGLLEAMTFEVDVDSTYEPKMKPYVVLRQMPDSGSSVKKGRMILVTVNKAIPPMIPMPGLAESGMSYRSAEMMLRNNKLQMGDTIMKPDIARGAVLQQLYNGKEIKAGDMIPMGAKVDLVVGDGLGNTQFNVPDVIGMVQDEAIILLNGNELHYTLIFEPPITDTATAIIYNQSPKAWSDLMTPNRIKAGDIVDLFIKQNPTPEELEGNRKGGPGVKPDSVKPR